MIRKPLAALVLAFLASAPVMAADSDVLFTYGGKDYRLNDLQPQLQQAFHDIQVESRAKMDNVLNQAMLDMHIKTLAEKSGKTVEAVSQELVKIEEVTAEEIQALYDQFKDRIGRPLAEVEAGLRQELENRKRQQIIVTLIDKLKKEGGFVNRLDVPEAPVLAMDLSPFHWKGNKDAKVTIVEFADYNCGACRQVKSQVDQVMKEYGDKVKLYYVDFPVTERGVAGATTQTARGAYCAGQQNKYWEFHDLAFQEPVTMEGAGNFAKMLELNQKAFNQCLESDESLKFVQDSTRMAAGLGINSTPTLMVNGQKVVLRHPAEDLTAEIKKRL